MARTILVVTSSRRISDELAASFGPLPPSMLPVNDRLLVIEQLARMSRLPAERFLVLPHDFEVADWQHRLLAAHRVRTLTVEAGAGACAALAATLPAVADRGTTAHVVCGATLIDDLSLDQSDVVGPPGSQPEGAPGYFSISRPLDLVADLHAAGADLPRALAAYHRRRPLLEARPRRTYFFGDKKSFHSSRRSFLSARAFNTVTSRGHRIVKSGENNEKIAAESLWFARLPEPMAGFCPTLIDRYRDGGRETYEIEYLPLATLGDMFVFGDTSLRQWADIFSACGAFMAACQGFQAPSPMATDRLYLEKTRDRLAQPGRGRLWAQAGGWSYNGVSLSSLPRLAQEAADCVGRAERRRGTLMHGDFCFSNILWDPERQAIKVIDPRGSAADGQPTLFGDPLYDLAKLYHSCLGLYDLILAGGYRCRIGEACAEMELFVTAGQRAIGGLFRRVWLADGAAGERAVASAAILLFLAMIPLHEDRPSRQDAFLANALRLAVAHGLGRVDA